MAKGKGDGIGRKAMVAAYQVDITGINRSKAELLRLNRAIELLRSGNYGGESGVKASRAISVGSKDVFVSKLDGLRGRVQKATQTAMTEGMNRGKEYQTFALVNAVTRTGLSGKGKNPEGRQGPGRDDTGAMIDSIVRNVEVQRNDSDVKITGFHGWPTEGRKYFAAQEKGTANIEAANSLGKSIIPVREFLKSALQALKR